MLNRRTAPLLAALLAAGVVLGACTFSAEPAPGSPASPDGYSTGGFPPPGQPPQPGQITPTPVLPPAPSDAPRPAEGPVPTEGPRSSASTPEPTGAVQPPPGS